MTLKLDIGFEQLLQLIRQLPAEQRARVKAALNGPTSEAPAHDKAFEELLLSGPVLTKAELDKVAEAREAINKWRGR
ncbi:MAG: hypothetical protein RBT71_04405 [Flavobacteriales bacterium]|jgi:hypothetical protein|nr:hypothetical protein [Flavobacteriales bacterium]